MKIKSKTCTHLSHVIYMWKGKYPSSRRRKNFFNLLANLNANTKSITHHTLLRMSESWKCKFDFSFSFSGLISEKLCWETSLWEREIRKEERCQEQWKKFNENYEENLKPLFSCHAVVFHCRYICDFFFVLTFFRKSSLHAKLFSVLYKKINFASSYEGVRKCGIQKFKIYLKNGKSSLTPKHNFYC